MSQASLALPASVAQRPAKLCSDALLAQRAARGDERAFAEVFERHHQAIYRYCLSILGNAEDAADALQSTMAAVLRGLDGETRQIALKPWLFRIAHNESLTILRRRRPQSELDETARCTRASVESEVLQSEQLRQMVQDVRALPDRQRSALVMRELNGLDYPEISAVFGVAEGAARQAVHEARTMLAEFAAGRAMACADIRELISARDGRRMRGRKVRSHLRACEACEDFRIAIGRRRAGLAAVAPPLGGPLAASILNGLLAGGSAGGAAASGLTAGAGATAAGTLAPVAVQSSGIAALVAKAGGSAAFVVKSVAALGATATIAGGTIAIERRLDAPAPPSVTREAAPAPITAQQLRGGGGESAAGATGTEQAGQSGGADAAGGGAGAGSAAGGASQTNAQAPDAAGTGGGTPLDPVAAQGGGDAPAVAGGLAGEAPGADAPNAPPAAVDGGLQAAQDALDTHDGPVTGGGGDDGSAAGTPGITAPVVAQLPPTSIPNTGVGVDPDAPVQVLPGVSVP